MGHKCRSICFTYCALRLHCSYLTLISSYHSQSLAVQVQNQVEVLFPNRESLHSRDRWALGFGTLQKWENIHANVLRHAYQNILTHNNSINSVVVNSLWHWGGRWQFTVSLWLQLQVVCKAAVPAEGARGVDVQKPGVSFHCMSTHIHTCFRRLPEHSVVLLIKICCLCSDVAQASGQV